MYEIKKNFLKQRDLAEKCLINGEYQKTEKILKKIIPLDLFNPELYYFLGEALCKQYRFKEALVLLTKADQLLPNHPRIYHLLGWVQFMNGDADLGRMTLKKALEKLPDDVSILCDLAVLENQVQNGQEAIEYATQAIKVDPGNELAQETFQAMTYFQKLRLNLVRRDN
ncbi:hypothetical protein COU94_01830 [Candidatus Shapirobacteria bacterium CG10_big_fil_rev_8_21_14_0_10_38_8]|nr:MAG: hypothetical protein COU94_01830 [Candidatus Shapirobacteria bacterium CG10_big_fil_rev_8_21_14_0_10_38_8]